MPSPRIAVPAAIVALAAASLLAPFAPLYDPWAWLVWGRELNELDLGTEAGPSWKPLAALLAALVAPAGEAAPDLWLALARVGWLSAVALAYRLAWRLMFPERLATSLAARFAPGRVRLARNLAGAIAAAGVVLVFDPFTSWTRQFAGGLSEPMLVALVLGAVDRELSRARGQALALGVAAALLRPEAWPLLAAYGVWLWRHQPALRRWVLAAAVALPALWLGMDLLGSGDPFTGARRARSATGAPLPEAIESLGRTFELPLAALWVGAAIAVATAREQAERRILVLAAGAGAWIAIVGALAAAGYAGLPRFAAPAAAAVCVLGGVGAIRLVAAIDGLRTADRRRRPAIALAALLAVALLVQGGLRAADVPGELERTGDYAAELEGLRGLVERAGEERLAACAPLTSTDFLAVPPLAWQLELPLSAVSVRTESAPPAGLVVARAGESSAAAEAAAATGRTLAREDGWVAYAISCPGAAATASR